MSIFSSQIEEIMKNVTVEGSIEDWTSYLKDNNILLKP